MSRVLFIDIKEKELSAHICHVRGNTCEMKETRSFPISGKHDFSFEMETGQIESAYVSLPAAWFNFRIIELPFSDKDKIRETLPFELDGVILGGSNTVIFDDVIVGKSENAVQVMAVYIEKNLLKKVLDALHSHSIDPVYVTCLELREKLADFTLPELLTPVLLEEKERIALACEEIKKPTINVRRGDFAYTRDIERTRKSLRAAAALLVFIALVFSGDVLLKIVSLRQESAAVKNEIRKQYMELFPGEKNIVNELYQLKSHLKELQEKKDVFIGIDTLGLLLNVSQLEREGISFHEIMEDKYAVTLKGEADSLSLIQQFTQKLDSLYNDVTIADSKSSARGNMLFTITSKGKR